MDDSLDILRIARDYVDGTISLDDVQEWLVPRLGIFLADPHSTASELAGLLELGFADIAAGEADEREFRDLISGFFREHDSIQLPSAVRTDTSNTTVSVETFVAGTPQGAFSQIELTPVGR